ncbi:hypothetical protein HPP92_023884 [Vanilla planifolia]|uniref:CCHC-type domain-containing protein n=1 Tax=Vanilla planifolia TaxID=51239 RepID=A0A835PN61_VANPL|nr:hypothetical protein HPP92_023884 [Vanilla planifolia]
MLYVSRGLRDDIRAALVALRTTSDIELLESARTVELELGILETSSRREKRKLFGIYIQTHEGERWPQFFPRRGGGRGSANRGRGRGSMASAKAAHGLQYNQAKERSASGNMDKGNGKEQQGDTQQELAQTLVSLLRSIGGTTLVAVQTTSYIELLESARTVELELGILETSRGREKGSFSGSTSRLTGRRGGPSFSRGGGTSYAKFSRFRPYEPSTSRTSFGSSGTSQWHMARDCPKVSDMKAANTPTSGGRGSANRGRGRGSMATSGSAAHGLQYNQAKERSESGNMDKGNGLQYNQAKERSESGNMDKGNGKEQQGDTQQELAQTLVSLLRSIGGTRHNTDCPKVSDMKVANAPNVGGGRECEPWVEAVDLWQLSGGAAHGGAAGLQYNQAKERSESGNMDKGNGHMARDCPKVSDMKAANTPTSGGRGSANRGRGRGSMATSGSAAHENSPSGQWPGGLWRESGVGWLEYNQAKERSESGNMDKGNGKEQQGDTQQELAQTLVSFFEIYREAPRLQYNQAKERSESGNMDKGNEGEKREAFQDLHPDSQGGEVAPVFPEEGVLVMPDSVGSDLMNLVPVGLVLVLVGPVDVGVVVDGIQGSADLILCDQLNVFLCNEIGHMARDCPKVSDMKAANTPTSGGRGSANRGRGRGSMATSGSAAHGLQYNQAKERSESGNMDKGNGKEQQGDTQQELAQTLVSLLRSIGGTRHMARDCPKVSNMKAANTPTGGGRGVRTVVGPWIYGNFRQCSPWWGSRQRRLMYFY